MGDPLAYFLTWTTYGSWLPGDGRWWVDSQGRFREPDPQRERLARERMTETELSFTALQRELVEKPVADHCRVRNWLLHEVNCRTQHVHVVVTAPGYAPEVVLEQFKAWCTRRLSQLQSKSGTQLREKWWTEKGSKRRLYDDDGLVAATYYVRHCQ